MHSKKLILTGAALLLTLSPYARAQDSTRMDALKVRLHAVVDEVCENAPQEKRYAYGFAEAVARENMDDFKSNLYKMGCLVRRAQRVEPKDTDVIDCAMGTIKGMMPAFDVLYPSAAESPDESTEGFDEQMVDLIKSTLVMTDSGICGAAGL